MWVDSGYDNKDSLHASCVHIRTSYLLGIPGKNLDYNDTLCRFTMTNL